MASSLTRLKLVRFLHFFLGNLLQKGGQFLLLPLLIATMTPAEFSRFGLFVSLIAAAVPLLTMNVHLSAGRLFFDHQPGRSRASLLITLLSAAIVSVLAVGLTATIILQLTSAMDPLSLGNGLLQVVLVVAVASTATAQFFALLFRLTDQSTLFTLLSSIMGGGILLLYTTIEPFVADKVLVGVIAYSGAQVIAVAVGILPGRRHFRGASLKLSELPHALNYSTGTAIYALIVWCNAFAGRWLGTASMAPEDLAPYTLLTYVYAGSVLLATIVFETSRIEVLRDFAAGRIDAAMRQVDRQFRIVLVLMIALFTVLHGVIALQDYLLPVEYHIGHGQLLLASGYVLAQCVFLRSFWAATGLKKTRAMALNIAAGAVVSVGGSLLLAPIWGTYGLLAASCAGGLTIAVIGTWSARHLISRAKAAQPSAPAMGGDDDGPAATA